MDSVARQPVLWDAKDVAAFLKVSRATVYRMKDAGRIPFVRVFGSLVRFDPEAIRALTQSGRI